MIRHKIAILLASCAIAVSAQNSGVPGDYLVLYFPSSSAMGIGGGSTALVDNSDALYTNPAGLGFSRYMELGMTYARFGSGENYYPAAFCAPFGKLGTAGM